MQNRFIIFLTFFIFTANIVFANPIWGKTGHRTLGEIAKKHLKKRVKRKIDKLLNGESLAFISTYADEIKSDRLYDKYYTWHYVNFKFNSNYHDSDKNAKGDLVSGINTCITALKNKMTTKESQIFHLKMLVHLIGDLHQPLHVGRAKDKGGNTIQVQWFDQGTNLHKVWDEHLIEQWNMSYIELANNTKKLTKKQIIKYQSGTILDWIYDSQKLAKKVYASVENGDKLKYNYSYEFLPIVRTQLQKGGVRLAKILNEIF